MNNPVDRLRTDPLLAEQLDALSAQIQQQIADDRKHALIELEITDEQLFDVPDVRAIDNGVYDDDPPAPVAPAKPVKLVMRDSDGNIISAPNSEVKRTLTGELILAAKPNTITTPPPPAPVDTKALEKSRQRKIAFRAKDQEYIDRLSNAFIESLGELDDLKQALALSDDSRAENFLKDLANPKYKAKKWTVSAIAHVNGITPSKLATIYRQYNLSKGMLRATAAIPAIIDHIVEDAKSKQVLCERCDGLQQIERRKKHLVNGVEQETVEWVDCPACDATGSIRQAGDAHARKTLTDMVDYTGKKGPLVQQNFISNANMSSVVDDLEDFGNAPIIDASYRES